MKRTKIRINNTIYAYVAILEGTKKADLSTSAISSVKCYLGRLPSKELVINGLNYSDNIVYFNINADSESVLGDYYIQIDYIKADNKAYSIKVYGFTLVDLNDEQTTISDPEVPPTVYVQGIVSINFPPQELIPRIGENGNWFIGDTDTGFPSRGDEGVGIASMMITNAGDLIVTYTNGQIQNAGTVIANNVITQDKLDVALTHIQQQITLNTNAISNLSGEVDGLREQINNRTHFRGSYQNETNLRNGVTDPVEGDYAYVIEPSPTQWNYGNNGSIIDWYDTGLGMPSNTTPLSDVEPLVDGIAAAGTSNEASRGDHRHPSDSSKQNALTAGSNVSIDNDIIAFIIPDSVLQYDSNGNVVFKPDAKLVMMVGNVGHEILGVNTYVIDGVTYYYSEVGAPSSHLNLNTNIDAIYGKYFTVDTPEGKEIGVYQSDISQFKKFATIPSKFVDGEFQGITYTELQNIANLEQEGYIPIADGVNLTSYNIRNSGDSIIFQYSYNYINTRITDGYTELHGFVVTINASEANVIVNKIEVMMPRISEVSYHLPNSFVTPNTDFNTLPDITWPQIQEAYRQFLLGRDFTSNIASLYGVTQFVVTDDVAALQYDFAKVTNNELVRYHALVTATEQNVATSVIPTDYDVLIQEKGWTGNTGSITSSGDYIELPLGTSGVIIRARYQSATIINLYMATQSGSVVVDYKRASIYGDTSQGSYGDGVTLTTTELLIDDVLNNSNDWCNFEVRVSGNWYSVKVFFSGDGSRCAMAYQKVL